MLGRIERLLEGAVEGTTRGLFRVQLQPVELAKAATRAMDGQMVVSPDGPEVANAYRIRLHPEDFARFAAYRVSLEAKIERYLDTYARDRGLRPVAPWRIELVADDSVPRRRVRVDAELSDAEMSGAQVSDVAVPSDGRLAYADGLLAYADGRLTHADDGDGTIALPSLTGSAVEVATITLEDGRELVLHDDVTSFGRALDNDVVIADGRVSRHHVQIVQDGRGLLVRDVGSTNGTSVAGRRGTEHRLADGDQISLGGYKIGVRIADRSA